MKKSWKRRFLRQQKHCARIFHVSLLLIYISGVNFHHYFVAVAEFRAYFDHVKSLGFEDRPDYDFLKRLFRELFFRKGFAYDNVFDWDLIGTHNPQTASSSSKKIESNPDLKLHEEPHPHIEDDTLIQDEQVQIVENGPMPLANNGKSIRTC